jgi:radical SAM superfamily enzyme YgiQ (UPF0313 family)
MNVLLINVAVREAHARTLLPAGFGSVASSVHRTGIAFDLLDLASHPRSPSETVEVLSSKPYDVVMMGCEVTAYRHVKRLSAIVRRALPASLIVVGNSVSESILETVLTNTDVDVAIADGDDETAVDLLRHIEWGEDLGAVHGIALRSPSGIVRTPRRPLTTVGREDTSPSPDPLALATWHPIGLDATRCGALALVDQALCNQVAKSTDPS